MSDRMILFALLTLAMTTGAASAQQRTFYDASEHVARRAARPTWSVLEPCRYGGADRSHAQLISSANAVFAPPFHAGTRSPTASESASN
jgi:hypothetical protein